MKKTRDYKGSERLCDAIVGVDHTRRDPHLLKCKNKAEKVYVTERGYKAYVCPGCLQRFIDSEKRKEL